MSDINTVFADLQAEIDKAFVYKPLTEERYQISCVNDIIEYADKIRGEWNGDEPGQLEDRARQADDIIGKCNELIELLEGMAEL
jgi:hypothetical protein